VHRFGKWRGWVLLAPLLLLAGCGLPPETIEEAKQLSQRLETFDQEISNRQQAMATRLSSPEGGWLKEYADREQWLDGYAQLKTDFDKKVRKAYKDHVSPLLKKNSSSDKALLTTWLAQVRVRFRPFPALLDQLETRETLITGARAHAQEWVEKAREQKPRIDAIHAGLVEHVDTVKQDYATRADEIQKRFVPREKLWADAGAALARAEEQLSKVAQKSADYAVLADGVKLVEANLAAITEEDKKFREELGQLYRSYSKTLKDMRTDYFVEIARADWCNSDGCGSGDQYRYPPAQVSDKAFEYFDKLSSSFSPHGAYWGELALDPYQNRRGSHNYAEFWVHNTFVKTYHKYLLDENGESKETDWEEVENDYFWANEGNLGMTLVSKPDGKFEDESDTVASPPGMDYIAQPVMTDGRPTGSNRYGEWRTDSSGHSFWHYYGQYAMFNALLGRDRGYGYDDWNRWNGGYRGRKPYYGELLDDPQAVPVAGTAAAGTVGSSNRAGPRWGTWGRETRNSSTLAGTRYAKSGGFGAATSVRGAGRSARGRGPGGGGK